MLFSRKLYNPLRNLFCKLRNGIFYKWSLFLYATGLLLLISVFSFLIYKATTATLPHAVSPIVFYANQSRQDLKLIFCEAIRSAKHSLFACFYGITDRDILSLITKRIADGIDVHIEYDPTASVSLSSQLPKTTLSARRSKGLMHRKILIIDDTYLFLGSANWTFSSLHHHSNFLMGLYSPSLAHFLSRPDSPQFSLVLGNQHLECWLLPDKQQQTLHRILSLIHSAKKSIRIAMFTLTHPQIASALITSLQRGVSLTVIVDSYSARGASKKTVDLLKDKGVCIKFSQGPQLLHHKWAVIDEEIFVMGSANWTKAAFTKNDDFILVLSPLTPNQKRYLNSLWECLRLESTTK